MLRQTFSPCWATQSSGARGRSGRSCSTPLLTRSSTLHVVLLLPRSAHAHVLAWPQQTKQPLFLALGVGTMAQVASVHLNSFHPPNCYLLGKVLGM